jgi:fatty acid desaturase
MPSSRPSYPFSPWPTIGIVALTYGGWLGLTWFHHALPFWAVILPAAYLGALHGSLQHETIHGHPTGRNWLDQAFAWPPLTFWLPYPIYRDDHLLHHRAALTDPRHDPESKYLTFDNWNAASTPWRWVLRAQLTLLGRMGIGPALVLAGFLAGEIRRVAGGDRQRAIVWALHLAACVPVALWAFWICGIAPLEYALAYVYGGLSLTLMRSFTEHRAATSDDERTAIVEAGPLLALLYLNNNLHAVHHAEPNLPWYVLPRRWREMRAQILAANGGFVFGGYDDIARRYALRAVHAPWHPDTELR